MRRWAAIAAAALLLLAACRDDRDDPSARSQRRARPADTPLEVTPAPEPVVADFLADRTLHLTSRPLPVHLGAPPHPALQGTLAPLIVPSPDGRFLAYSTFAEAVTLDPARPPSAQGIRPGDVLGTPSVVVHDLATGTERTLAEGAFSPAWRADGALAYVQGTDPAFRANARYAGQVMVRPAVDAEPTPWTVVEGRYVVAGWAGNSLVLYHEAGNESFDLEIADEPGAVRTLVPAGSLVALSADGARAAVAVNASGASSHLEIVDLASGEAKAISPDLPRTSLIYDGSWVGSRIVARGGDAEGSFVAVFDAAGDGLALDRMLRVDARFPNGLAEPRLDPRDPNRFVAWSFVPESRRSGAYVLVRCEVAASKCRSGPPVEAKVLRLYG